MVYPVLLHVLKIIHLPLCTLLISLHLFLPLDCELKENRSYILFIIVVFSEVPIQYQASLVAQLVKNPPAMGETGSDPWVGRTPWRRTWQPTAVFLPGECRGQRSLAGYSPWGCTKSDMTEQLSRVLYQSYTDLYTPHLRTEGGSTEAFG